MTKIPNRTTFGIIAISALVLLVSVTSSLNNTTDVKADVFMFEKDESITLKATPQELLDDGINSAIVITANQKNVDLVRGMDTVVIFTISHVGGNEPAPRITLQADGIKGLIIPPSVLAQSVVEDRIEEFKRTGTILGAIDLSTIVTYAPNTITLLPGESKTIEMHIIMPKLWNDELSGDVVSFEPNIRRIGNYDGYKIAVFSDDTEIRIGE
jgi:hypothetical protein